MRYHQAEGEPIDDESSGVFGKAQLFRGTAQPAATLRPKIEEEIAHEAAVGRLAIITGTNSRDSFSEYRLDGFPVSFAAHDILCPQQAALVIEQAGEVAATIGHAKDPAVP